jgi:hypothetical protein
MHQQGGLIAFNLNYPHRALKGGYFVFVWSAHGKWRVESMNLALLT